LSTLKHCQDASIYADGAPCFFQLPKNDYITFQGWDIVYLGENPMVVVLSGNRHSTDPMDFHRGTIAKMHYSSH
jgi:hypothetical protein